MPTHGTSPPAPPVRRGGRGCPSPGRLPGRPPPDRAGRGAVAYPGRPPGAGPAQPAPARGRPRRGGEGGTVGAGTWGGIGPPPTPTPSRSAGGGGGGQGPLSPLGCPAPRGSSRPRAAEPRVAAALCGGHMLHSGACPVSYRTGVEREKTDHKHTHIYTYASRVRAAVQRAYASAVPSPPPARCEPRPKPLRAAGEMRSLAGPRELRRGRRGKREHSPPAHTRCGQPGESCC